MLRCIAVRADQSTALGPTSANRNGVSHPGPTISAPPPHMEMQAFASKLDELIGALRR